ncbi:MAG: nitrate reductase molybdenum cofactor assembly chaperone [Rhodocyclaceae bacterium]|nr:nitrate reductase molybdenum cofactor assembly chaperone [Rhodocyclaceae bacterium]
MLTYRLIALLLDYPSDEAMAALRSEVQRAGEASTLVCRIAAADALDTQETDAIAAFVEDLLALPEGEAQARYVQTFDLAAEHSLHLTHHLFGEEKTRGPALIDLSEFYRSYGFEPDPKELPDYLPLMLEFASTLDATEQRVFLGDVNKVLAVLAANLEKTASPYAPLIRIIENHSALATLAA